MGVAGDGRVWTKERQGDGRHKKWTEPSALQRGPYATGTNPCMASQVHAPDVGQMMLHALLPPTRIANGRGERFYSQGTTLGNLEQKMPTECIDCQLWRIVTCGMYKNIRLTCQACPICYAAHATKNKLPSYLPLSPPKKQWAGF